MIPIKDNFPKNVVNFGFSLLRNRIEKHTYYCWLIDSLISLAEDSFLSNPIQI